MGDVGVIVTKLGPHEVKNGVTHSLLEGGDVVSEALEVGHANVSTVRSPLP